MFKKLFELYLMPYNKLKLSLFRRNYIECLIMEKYGGSFRLLKRLYINIKEDKFNYHNRTYLIKLDFALFTDKAYPVLYYTTDNVEPLSFNEMITKVDNAQLKSILETNVFNKIFFAQRDKFFTIIICVLGIAIIGISLFAIYYISKNQNLLIDVISKMTTGEYIVE